MESQTNVGDQNTQQVGQAAVNRSTQFPEKPKIKYITIGIAVFVGLVIFGFGAYYFGERSSKITTKQNQEQTAPLPGTSENEITANSNIYKNTRYGIAFDYPQNYSISTEPDCGGLIDNQSDCLIALVINASNTDYPSAAHFWLLKVINSVRIDGQVSSISFDSQKNKWIVDEGFSPAEILPVWDHTKSGQEIIRASNGGSHGSSNYFLIPNYIDDEIAIFAIPQSYRLRCDNFSTDKSREADCNNFYKSVIDKYNEGEITVDTWLPGNYFNSIYSEAETMIKSFENIADANNGNVEKAIDILKAIPEIQIIENSVIKAGRKPFYTPEGENGDIVHISLRESFPDDPHTTRIDTFSVNIKSRTITVEDVVSGKDISLEEWKKKVNQNWGF